MQSDGKSVKVVSLATPLILQNFLDVKVQRYGGSVVCFGKSETSLTLVQEFRQAHIFLIFLL